MSVDDSQQSRPLTTTNEPKGPVGKKGGKGSMGEQAFNDAVLMVGIAWLVLFLLVFSLRSYNV
ncbi:MAG TPA: hypothetical protein VIY48_02470 [Candidatus Paceibacterota bacterium]|jgi:hypothetical protein